MSELMLDVGQANELKLAFRRAGYSNEMIKHLCNKGVLEQFGLVLNGRARVSLRQARYHILESQCKYHEAINQFADDLEGPDNYVRQKEMADMRSNFNKNPSENKWINELCDREKQIGATFTVVQHRKEVILPGCPYVVLHTILEEVILDERKEMISDYL